MLKRLIEPKPNDKRRLSCTPLSRPEEKGSKVISSLRGSPEP